MREGVLSDGEVNSHAYDLRRCSPVQVCKRIAAGQRHGFVSEGDLNPHTGEISPDLGLNSKTGEKSPDRGVHAAMVAGMPGLASNAFH